MSRVSGWWRDVSIVKKLYLVIGVMAVLIASELLVLRFAMRTLSASRAFVVGESHWSRNQKSAVTNLLRYIVTGEENAYVAFEKNLEVPKGDRQARLALFTEKPNLDLARQGFERGHNHPDDIEPMIELLQRFYWVSYLDTAIKAWSAADIMLAKIEDFAAQYRASPKSYSREATRNLIDQVAELDAQMSPLEARFSYSLGEGCRWLEYMVLSVLTIVVLTVESFGLSLAYIVTRHLSRGLNTLGAITRKIGHGDFATPIEISGRDEIGRLAADVNSMRALLNASYTDLENRVAERTQELNRAVESRDEFLSIASHELKTPLTSLYLQIQMMARAIARNDKEPLSLETLKEMTKRSGQHATVLSNLIDRLLDLTRLRIGKFAIQPEACDVSEIVGNVVSEMGAQAQHAKVQIAFTHVDQALGRFDAFRIGEVATNFISNAIKYGGGTPIDVAVKNDGAQVEISVADHGQGISSDDQQKIFALFERGRPDPGVSGLGLGLYISNEIVKAHGGRIDVQSELGSGTKFTAVLPLA